MLKSKRQTQNGFVPLFPILAIAVIVVGLVAVVHLTQKKQIVASHAAATVTNRITWQNGSWYLHGANLPWFNWACDFGCNAQTGKSGGVSTNTQAVSAVLQQAHGAGIHVVRWWVFPGDPWQISRDANNVPVGINPAVYTDFDAALKLAQQYDVYYDFVLFSAPTAMPTAWETNVTQRAALAKTVGQLAAHYRGNARILSWELYNEPENDIWNNKIAQQPVVDTATALTQAIHTNAPGSMVTIGNLMADGMPMWANVGLDYYSPHWYDYMSSGNYCIICHPASYYKALYNITKPIVVGEFYTGTSSTSPYSSGYRYNFFYTNGYAGAWAWSLLPSHTSDKLAMDFTAAQQFASQHSGIGPLAPNSSAVPTIQPTSAPTNVPSPTLQPTRKPTHRPRR